MKLTWSVLVLALLVGVHAYADDLSDLEQSAAAITVTGDRPSVDKPQWRATADALENVEAPKVCAETTFTMIGTKYVVSKDKTTGKPCRLYDLTFPSLQTLIKSFKVSSLPMQKFTRRDYNDWTQGRVKEVNNRMNRFALGKTDYASNEEPIETADWVNELQVGGSTNFAGTNNLPKTFYASDLNVGKDFVFAVTDRQRLRTLIAILSDAGENKETIKAWTDVVENPKSFLKNIRFDRNEAKKVYDIVLTGEFLPIKGPVTLVDYHMPHKPAVESLIRNVLFSALYQIAGFIPELATRQIIRVVIEDTYTKLEMAYRYQFNQLESALRATSPTISGSIDHAFLDQSIDLVFANQGDVLTAYLQAMSTKKQLDMAKMGRQARYATEKSRDIIMNTTNNRLVQKNRCRVTMMFDYFTECKQVNGQRSIYTLLNTNTVFMFYNMGAPRIYSYNAPYDTVIRRGVAYLLSVGIRIMDLGFPSQLKDKLLEAADVVAHSGVTSEAFLKAGLQSTKQSHGMLSAENDKLLKMLYIQHLNPFLPFSEAQEAKYVQANRGILKLSSAATQPAQH